MTVYDERQEQRRLTFNEVLTQIREKKVWLRPADKQRLLKKHGLSESALRRQLSGQTRRINFDLMADALDMINEHERSIVSRLL